MNKVVQISILAKIIGNVNADEVIGTRTTLKKMYSSSGEVLPFVSARAIKFSIRKALKEKGLDDVDPLYVNPEAEETLRLADSARPDKYIDNDLFGYMRTVGGRGEEGAALKRQAPVAISYLIALKDTPVKAEFAARFPRPWGEQENPAPFEVEVAEFIGKVNCIMYDYIGRFKEEKEIAKKIAKKINDEGVKKFLQEVPDELPEEKRKERIKAFLDVFLTPSYVLPRRTNSLNIPEYIAALIVLSEKGPLPALQYLNYNFEENKVDVKSLETLMEREEIKGSNARIFFIDYFNKIENLPQGVEKKTVKQVIDEVVKFL